MRRRLAAVLTVTLLAGILAPIHTSMAGPIIKPRKYHGPIPRNSITLRAGFVGGPTNEQMIEFLDGFIVAPFKGQSTDFSSSSPMFELAYTYKTHPKFAVRANVSVSLLRSSGDGFYVPRTGTLPDSLLADIVDYERVFDIDLFVIEASAMYFFEDASVNEFQPYIGGGFSLGIPHAKFLENRISRDTGTNFPEEHNQWTTEAGVHGLLGAYYYITNRFAVNIESRLQMVQTRFPLTTRNESGGPEEVKLDVDFTGFFLAFGITRSF